MLQRNVHAIVFGVVIFDVPLAERAASAVFAAQPHRRAFQHQAAERQHFRQRPIDMRLSACKRFAALLDEAGQLRMQMEIRRETW